MTVETLFLAILPSLCVSVIMLFVNAKQSKAMKESDARAKARKRETLLSMELQMATAKMSYAVAMALKRGHANGEVEEAIEAYEEARKKYLDFLNEHAAEQIGRAHV